MPSSGDAQQALQRALAACQRGDWAEAERMCRQALAASPGAFEALYLLGVAAGQSGRPQEAAEHLARAVAANPSRPEAHFNRGVALGELGRHAEAEQCYARVAALAPGNADAHFNRGASLGALGRHEEALACYDAAIGLRAAHAEAHHNRGVALAQLQRPAEAIESYRRAVALRPDYASAYNNLGVALGTLGRHEEAIAAYRRALALRADFANAHSNLAISLLDLDRAAESLASCDRALALRPDHADAWYHRANALRELHRHEEAAQGYERAIAIDPAHASAHWNLADLRLLLGDFARGWREYEWRWKLAGRRQAQRDFAQPLWLGEGGIEGKTLLLHSELGLGDTLQFCRYATGAARRGARVLLEVQPPLVELLRTLDGVAEVLPRGTALPPFDLHCPIMSLPLAFHTEAAAIPAPIPYLRSDPRRVEAWRARLGATGKRRVGLVWSGSRGLRNDKRSMTLVQALPLLDGVHEWVSLQKDVPAADAALLGTRSDLRQFTSHLTDFAETAALVELLDLVVTVDTSVAHVAGAMGKPVWILLPRNQHDWRWQLERADSPWYPTARLFRQAANGDWAGVVERVRAALGRQP